MKGPDLPVSDPRGNLARMDTTSHDETPTTTENMEAAMSTRYAELQRLVASMEQDFHKFFNQGNKAAGTRVRQAMQELKTFAQNVRTEVLQMRNSVKPE
jgi:hypothetical protein